MPPLLFGVFQAIVAAKIRGCQGTEAHFFNATTPPAQRAPAETRFDDLGGRQGGAQVGRLFESQLQGCGPKVFYPLTP